MNILIYQSTVVAPDKGGISRMSKVLSDILAKHGHDVHYLSSDRKGRELLPGQLLLKGESLSEKHASFDETVNDYRIGLMIYQDGITPYNNHIIRWAKARGLKIIDVLHNSLRGMYGIEGHPSLSRICPRFMKGGINCLVNNFFKIKYGKLYREQFLLSDRIVLLSDKYRDEVGYFTGWHDFSKYTAIPNPLTLDRPGSINTNKKKAVLNVALLNHQKRHDLLLDVWKRVEEKRPDWSLQIVGDGPLRAKLSEQAKSLKLQRMEFLGFQQPQPFYDEASIFCLTSGYEGFGLVLVEAMAYGCVPIAFDSWELASDIIDHEVNGLLVRPFDVDAYAEKLIALMDDRQAREEMAWKAEEKSHSFDIDRISVLWIHLLEELKHEKEYVHPR